MAEKFYSPQRSTIPRIHTIIICMKRNVRGKEKIRTLLFR